MRLESLLSLTELAQVLEGDEFSLCEILFHFSYSVHNMH